jgi:hypothetical protein
VLLALLIASGGCFGSNVKDAAKGHVAAPSLALRVRYQLGGPLHGEFAGGKPLAKQAVTPERALALDVAVVALAARPSWDLAPLASQARVVMEEGEAGDRILATPRALEEARTGCLEGTPAALADQAGADAQGRGTTLAKLEACLVAGATTVVELERDVARHERAALLLGRRPDGIAAALELQGAGAPELVTVAKPLFTKLPSTSSWVALVPSPFDGEEARWIAIVVRAAPPVVLPASGAGAHEDAVGAAARDLAAQQQAAALATAPPEPEPEVPDVEATRRALWDRAGARRALHALAQATHAHTAEALAVLADDHTLAPIASQVAVALGSAPATGQPAVLGLQVELATLAACEKKLADEPVPEDLVSALEWRGGAALKLLPSLHDEIAKARTLDELEREIVEINVRLLLDASPAVRARATRWLQARMPLEGYSPIAPSGERRAAVDRIRKHLTEGNREGR